MDGWQEGRDGNDNLYQVRREREKLGKSEKSELG